MWEEIKEIYNENHIGINVGVFTGFISGFLTACLFRIIQLITDMKFYHNVKKNYTGSYFAYWKYDERNKKVFDINITTCKNFLNFNGFRIDDETKLTGKVEISKALQNYGTGYYVHDKGWGFIELQRGSEGQIFIHQVYSDRTNQITQALTWLKK
ncbi:hypothetical protein KJ840_05510 [Patescibacteria group bacterium]|nr:hypothetical protein [Patescibacteria group bacterium]